MRIVLLAMMIAICASGASAQMKRSASSIEPVRTMSGWMQGRQITVSSMDGKPAFQLELTKAEINDGRLSFVSAKSGSSKPVQATLIGTLAQSANPWPGSADRPPSRQARNTEARAPEQPNEQNQSLFSAAGVGSGCEVLFLRMEMPKAVQVGVVLNRQDNQRGGDINQAICRVARAMEAKSDTARPLSDLNRLLAAK
jgi:hypothetical protein